ncbi:MAG: translocation/assembly module TamB domain-containing protein [Acidobacteriota bacterium]
MPPIRRLLIRSILVITALIVLAIIGAVLFLGSNSGAEWAYDLTRTTLAEADVAFEADGLAIRPLAGQATLDGVRVGAVDQPPFLTAERVDVTVALLSLLGRPTIRSLMIDSPRLDLDAPFPSGGASDEQETASGASAPVDILEIQIDDGSVSTTSLPDPVAELISGVSVGSLVLRGHWRDDAIDTEIERGTLRIVGRPPEEADDVDTEIITELRATVRGATLGPYDTDPIALDGDDLRLDGSARIGLGDGEPFFVDATIMLQPEALVPSATGSRIEADLTLDLRTLDGTLDARLDDVPGALLDALVELDPAVATDLIATKVDLDTKLELDGLDDARGNVDLVWWRDDEALARLSAVTVDADRPGITFDLDGEIPLPIDGSRSLDARLHLPALDAFDQTEILEAQADLDVADLDALRTVLVDRFPSIAPPILADLPLIGSLESIARASGPLLAPHLIANGTWRPTPDSRVVADADAYPADLKGTANLEIVDLPLDRLLDFESGRISGAVQLDGTIDAFTADATLDAENLGLGEDRPTVDRVTLRADADNTQIRFRALEAIAGERQLRADGTVQLDLAREDFIRGARFELAAERPSPSLDTATAELTLDAGTLSLDNLRATGQGGTLTASARAPLASLLALGDVTADPPTPMARGPVTVAARLPPTDAWRAILADWKIELPVALRGGFALDASLDPEALDEATATLSLVELSAGLVGAGLVDEGNEDGPTIAVDQSLELRLADRVATLAPTTLDIAGERITIGGDARLDPAWRPGAPPTELIRNGRLHLQAPQLDVGALAAAFGSELPVGLVTPVDFETEITPADLTATSSTLVLDTPRVELVGGTVTTDTALSVRLTDATVVLEPVVWRTEPRSDAEPLAFRTEARIELDSDWRPDRPPLDLLGPIQARLHALEPITNTSLAALFEAEESFGRDADFTIETGLDIEFTIDPDRPTAGQGRIELSDFVARFAELDVEADGPIVARLDDHAVMLEEGLFIGAEQPTVYRGEIELDPAWNLDRPADDLVRDIDFALVGSLQTDLLSRLIGRAATTGDIAFDINLRGPLGGLSGYARFRGPDAAITLFDPYYTRLSAFDISLALADGALDIERFDTALNEGTLTVDGGRAEDGTVELTATLADVRYRVDYGLTSELGGTLTYRGAPDDAGSLTGRIDIERGLLQRDLDPDREVLDRIVNTLAGEAVAPAAPGPLDAMVLDIDVRTTEGIRVKNNVADLDLLWATPINIRGYLGQPRVEGTIEVTPPGWVWAYGQTLRVNSAALTFRGDPAIVPELELDTTSSLEEPSIAEEGARRFPLGDLRSTSDSGPGRWRRQQEADQNAYLASSVASYYGDRLAGSLDQNLGTGTSLTIRPLFVYGVNDPGARFTLSQEVSTNLSFAVSVDLNEAGEQTYLVEIDDLPFLPQLVTQVYTTDEEEQGSVLQQLIEFGGGPTIEEGGPRLDNIDIDAPEDVSARKLRRALSFEKGEPLPEGAAFDIELEVADALRDLGYPGATVTVETRPGKKDRVDLDIAIEPGPKVDVEFRGDAPSRKARKRIASYYSPTFYEPVTLEDMLGETRRALRADGCLAPTATIRVEEQGESRLVIVDGACGDKVKLAKPRFEGVDAEVATAIALRFPNQSLRAELLDGLGTADARIRAAGAALGHPRVEVLARRLDDKTPVITLDAGPRHRVSDIRIEGLEPELLATVENQLTPGPIGEPQRAGELSGRAIAIERLLHQQGYAAARVQTRFAEDNRLIAGAPSIDVVYDVERGPLVTLTDVDFDGLRSARPTWAENAADLDVGQPFNREAVANARRRLYETQVFESVMSRVERDGGDTTVTFDVRERDRFRIAWGVLFQTDTGASIVLDALDRNLLGRGINLGIRARWEADDRSAKIYGRLPTLLGSRASLEVFFEDRRFEDEGLITEIQDGTVQLSIPLRSDLLGRIRGQYRTSRVFDPEPFVCDPDDFFCFPIDIDFTLNRPIIGLELILDNRDDPIYTTSGWFATADLSGAGDYIGSDFSYLRFLGHVSNARVISQIDGRPIVWAQSYRLGLADAFDGQELIRDERFFTGGEYSLRGYDRESVGPQEQLGDDLRRPTGGEALLVLNQELRIPTYGDLLTSVLFVDVGNIWRDLGDIGDDYIWSAGVGARFSTPVGLVRLDVAYPFDRQDGDDEVVFYLGLGNVF